MVPSPRPSHIAWEHRDFQQAIVGNFHSLKELLLVLRKPYEKTNPKHPPYAAARPIYHGLDTDRDKGICREETTSLFKAEKLKHPKHTVPGIFFVDYEDRRVPDFYSDKGVSTNRVQ
jgi:hypothetical protein